MLRRVSFLVVLLLFISVSYAKGYKIRYDFSDNERVRYKVVTKNISGFILFGIDKSFKRKTELTIGQKIKQFGDNYEVTSNLMSGVIEEKGKKKVLGVDDGIGKRSSVMMTKTGKLLNINIESDQTTSFENPLDLSFPEKEVKPGDKWTSKKKMNMKQGVKELKNFEVESEYELKKVIKDGNREIAIMNYVIKGGKMLERDVNITLSGKGLLRFDLTNGRILENKSSMDVRGIVTDSNNEKNIKKVFFDFYSKILIKFNLVEL